MILEKIQSDLKKALRQKEEIGVATRRLLLAEIHNKKIEKRSELSEEEIVGVIRKEVRKRKEAIEAYQKGGRSDLVEKEKKEVEILSSYLPQEISPQQLEKIVKETIVKTGAKDPQDFGRVRKEVMAKVKGRAEGKSVASMVKNCLG